MDVGAIMKKTRIAVYLGSDPSWGGSHQYAQGIISALASLDPHNFDIRVFYTNNCWKPFLDKALLNNFKTYTHPLYFSKITLKIIFAYFFKKKSMLSKIEKQKIINFEKWNPHIYITPQMTGFPYKNNAKHIGVIHDLMHRYEAQFPEVGTKEEVEARDSVFSYVVEHAQTILVDSNIGKAHVYECYSNVQANIEVLPFTVFKDQMPAHSQKPKAQLPKKFFFYPAQFWQHKNHKRLAEALSICLEQNPEQCPKQCKDMHFVLTGGTDKNGYDAFQECIKALNIEKHFSILGYVKAEEIVWLYENAQALVMPTFFGPTNIPPLEAFSKVCPVAISDIYGHREEYGDAALYFDPKSSASIADVLYKLWTDNELCTVLSQKGLERANAWTEEDFKKRLLDIIYKIEINN